jgi:hypothetical protein
MDIPDPKELAKVNAHTLLQKYGPAVAPHLVLEHGSKEKQRLMLQELARELFEFEPNFNDAQCMKAQIKKLAAIEGLVEDVFAHICNKYDVSTVLFLMSLGADINASYLSSEHKDIEGLRAFKQNTALCSVQYSTESFAAITILLSKGADPNVIYCQHRDIWPLFLLKGNTLTDTQKSVVLQCMLDAGLDRKFKFPHLQKETGIMVYQSFDEILDSDIKEVKNQPVGTNPTFLPARFVWDVIQGLKF